MKAKNGSPPAKKPRDIEKKQTDEKDLVKNIVNSGQEHRVVQIQANVRGRLARKQVEEKKMSKNAVSIPSTRGRQERQERHNSATKIQASFRGN
jgi:hypothetical protein